MSIYSFITFLYFLILANVSWITVLIASLTVKPCYLHQYLKFFLVPERPLSCVANSMSVDNLETQWTRASVFIILAVTSNTTRLAWWGLSRECLSETTWNNLPGYIIAVDAIIPYPPFTAGTCWKGGCYVSLDNIISDVLKSHRIVQKKAALVGWMGSSNKISL